MPCLSVSTNSLLGGQFKKMTGARNSIGLLTRINRGMFSSHPHTLHYPFFSTMRSSCTPQSYCNPFLFSREESGFACLHVLMYYDGSRLRAPLTKVHSWTPSLFAYTPPPLRHRNTVPPLPCHAHKMNNSNLFSLAVQHWKDPSHGAPRMHEIEGK
jgi:hypothetical protein